MRSTKHSVARSMLPSYHPSQVRSAKHIVVGLSADSGCVHDYNLGRLRSLLYQCLYNGTTSNASEYAAPHLAAPRCTSLHLTASCTCPPCPLLTTDY